MRLATGKLPSELLGRLLSSVPRDDPRVIVGPGVGLDAAVIALDDEHCLVAKSDPITFATDLIGWYAVQVCANDIATTAAVPRWFMATVLLPDADNNAELAEEIIAQLSEACAALEISLVGGHTEITYGLDRPLVCGVMLGEVRRDRLVVSSGVRPGDAIILSKGIAVEGTAIIAREKGDELCGDLEPALLARCKNFLTDPGISVLKEAGIAVQAGRVHAMHDPTEGGLANGLWEMAQASGVSLAIDVPVVPVYTETLELCRLIGLDPWGLIASGALLLAVEADDAKRIIDAMVAAGIRASVIGYAIEATHGVAVYQHQEARDDASLLPRFERDEIARLFD